MSDEYINFSNNNPQSQAIEDYYFVNDDKFTIPCLE